MLRSEDRGEGRGVVVWSPPDRRPAAAPPVAGPPFFCWQRSTKRYRKSKSRWLSETPDTPAFTCKYPSGANAPGPQCQRRPRQSGRPPWSGGTPEERSGTRLSSLLCEFAAMHAAGPDSGRPQFPPPLPPLRPTAQHSSRKRQSSQRRLPVIRRPISCAASRERDCKRGVRHHRRPGGVCLAE